MLYADAGIYMPDVEDDAGLFAPGQAAAGAQSRELPRLLRSRRLAASGSDERQEMLSALTTNVTRFFREPHHFEHLSAHVLPPLLEAARRGGRVRLWSAACSTGPEPYSMALTVLGLEPNAASLDVQILATDIDPRVVEEGRRGIYPAAALAEAPSTLRKRYFAGVGGDERRGLQASDELRRLVVFRDAQSQRRLADAGQVPRHLLPQRRHLFRRADPADGVEQVRRQARAGRRALHRPFGARDRAGGGALRQRRRHRLSAQGRSGA